MPRIRQEISTKEKVIGILLSIITAIYVPILGLICVFIPLFSGTVLYDRSWEDTQIAVFFLITFPITIAGSLAMAWFMYKRGRFGIALLVTIVPIVHSTYLFWRLFPLGFG